MTRYFRWVKPPKNSVDISWVSAIFILRMWNWIKSLFVRKPKADPKEHVIRFRLPDGKIIDITAIEIDVNKR